jgi:predicted acylesterase/phospholipase RssA
MKFFQVLATLSVIGYVNQASATKCFGLAMSGGDQNSAFQVGALQALIKNLPGDQVQYTTVTGSAGAAVNAMLLSTQPLGQEQAAVDKMKQFWIDGGNTPLY